ncbi:MAG: copper homeostasis protein CutC [Bacteroidetes bacterium]|nr:MAG: copper homeostasis protein CutC [Bacteroidota bacterium]
MNQQFIMEVCIDSVASALAAEAGGAQRVELCDNLMEGGTTPSAGMLHTCLKSTSLEVMVMIRPRGGDFLYDEVEFEVMKQDVLAAKAAGAHGVVFGLLDANGHIDAVRTRELIALARPMQVTFHRAFDMTSDPHQALDVLIQLGVERVLTSGQEAEAHKGIPLIKALAAQSRGRIAVMAGGGVNESNIAEILTQTGINEIHLTGRHKVPSKMIYRNERVFMGVPHAPEYEKLITDPSRIRHMRESWQKQF